MKGRVQIENAVVEKIAALACLEVAAVARIGGNVAKQLEPLSGASLDDNLTEPSAPISERAGTRTKRGSPGVYARIEERQVRIDVALVIEYGAVVKDVANAVKANVAQALSHMLGLLVAEVNVTIDDVVLPRPTRSGAHAVRVDEIGGPTTSAAP